MDAVELAKRLISYDTVSPVQDTEAVGFLVELLDRHGIDAEVVDIGGVKNLVATIGTGDPRICLNGHLDVVEPGRGWTVTGPFRPIEQDGRLYGRGAADMKAALAAQIRAFIDLYQDPDFDGTVTLMVVGDEERGGHHGTLQLLERFDPFDYAIIGEPTDMDLQVGVRGIVWANVYLRGTSHHAARPHQAENITGRLPDAIRALESMELTHDGVGPFPEPTAPITEIETSGPRNSLPGEVRIGLDIRHLPSQDQDTIGADICAALDAVEPELDYELELMDMGGAFLLEDGGFREASLGAITDATGREPEEVTVGGSSDGRFFAQKGTPFIELGVEQHPGHRVDESCSIEQVRQLRTIYVDITRRLAEQG